MEPTDPAPPPATPHREAAASWVRLSIVVLALIVAGVWIVWRARHAPPIAKRAFDARPLQRVRSVRPDFVVIGNSMAGTRINERTLNQVLAPRRAVSITYGGSRAAVWYLVFKNYVVASGVRPQRVIIFFRYQELTELTYRDTGFDQIQIEHASPDFDPVVEAKLFPPPSDPVKRLGWELGKLVPISRLRAAVGDHTQLWFDEISTGLGAEPDLKKRRQLVNAPFALERLRGAPAAAASAGAAVFDFASTVNGSFLPELLSLSKSSGIPLAFVRIRPRSVAEGTPESPEMKTYVAELERYIEARGAMFVDMSGAAWESAELYKNGDHIGPRYHAQYTRLFVENLPELFR